ncbi:MAG TPA: thiamine pyrophosphate-binding protein [Microbacteriaceae bacterium]|nr:thiamine pyrophosphate-binding protein [Microbacteriaceae bacterium]
MPEPSASSQRARDVLAAALASGVRHLVVSPGARSQALALEAAALADAGLATLHVRTDERGAAFFALGIGRESGIPAVVITTSGSAVANLLPAVVEAHHAGVPMLILSADRPASMRASRANQTTLHVPMLEAFVRESVDVEPAQFGSDGLARPVDVDRLLAVSRGVAPGADGQLSAGPVHLNLQFVEPLSGPAAAATEPHTRSWSVPAAQSTPVEVGLRTLVIAGAGAGEAAEQFARDLDAPLIAEVCSGAHFGPNLVVPYRRLLRLGEFAETVERVVVFGTPTLSREVAGLCRSVPELLVVDSPGADRYRPAGREVEAISVAAVTATGAPGPELAEWRSIWVAAGRKLLSEAHQDLPVLPNGVGRDGHVDEFAAQRAFLANELAAIRAPITRESLVSAVWDATWPRDRLVFGASRLIRVADAILPGKRVSVSANRGLSGIDGTVSTALGISAANPEGLTRVILGDLAALHDVTALQLTPGEPFPQLQVIVGNDRGGTIFTGLEVAATADPGAFERVQLTPHDVDFAALAAAYGWEFERVRDVGALGQALTTRTERPKLIEVPLEG